jgi:predicted deacetylase
VPVHVSLHDVSPAWEREIDVALDFCATIGARPALLVVPNFHGNWPLDAHPAFAERLRALQADGHEVYLHGYFHEAQTPPWRASARPTFAPMRNLSWLWAQKIVSGGEAEFREVTPPQAEARLDEGEAMLERVGLRVDGFVAPAWAMHPWLLPILAKRGYAFTEDHLFVYDPAAGLRRASVVLNFASRTPGRLLSSVAWCRLAKHARAAVPARIAIHPADMQFHLLRHETKVLLDWAKDDLVDRGADLVS